MSDDDVPTLSQDTLAALNEFYQEQKAAAESPDWHQLFKEDWQLSQFWYDSNTVDVLTDEIARVTGPGGKIALISCPTLYPRVKTKCPDREVMLFEYDSRFSALGGDFHFYDYKNPIDLPVEFSQKFDIVVADPPFLSEECLTKTAVTVRFLTASKIILCTGSVMEALAQRLLNVEKTPFQPKHKNNLGNEFSCLTNYTHNFKSCGT